MNLSAPDWLRYAVVTGLHGADGGGRFKYKLSLIMGRFALSD